MTSDGDEAKMGKNEALMARNNFKQRVTCSNEQSGAKMSSSERSGAKIRQK
jgi:hypothetical protein